MLVLREPRERHPDGDGGVQEVLHASVRRVGGLVPALDFVVQCGFCLALAGGAAAGQPSFRHPAAIFTPAAVSAACCCLPRALELLYGRCRRR
ncbi:hypothetical protein JKP88DRAFT_231393 [Tribonema minus]|uniref:Uncharacterized protein n=1 Tax=Tribonema minus TaxID=303371 RepID=A0A836CPT2_9STRA|nr:hypothetical protein JKP88DRAFT_231393 [Tribonema minus]